MRYDLYFRNGTVITVESMRTLDELSKFFTEQVAKETPGIWGVLNENGEPQAMVSIIDLIAVAPNRTPPTPATVIDKDGDIWVEVSPGSDQWDMISPRADTTLAKITEEFGPLKSEISR